MGLYQEFISILTVLHYQATDIKLRIYEKPKAYANCCFYGFLVVSTSKRKQCGNNYRKWLFHPMCLHLKVGQHDHVIQTIDTNAHLVL